MRTNTQSTTLVNNSVANTARFIFSNKEVESAVKEVIASRYHVIINSINTQKERAQQILNARKEEMIKKQDKKRVQGTVAKLKKEVLERIQLLRKEKSIGGAIQTANKLELFISSIKEVIIMHGNKKTIRLGRYTKQELFGLVDQAFNAACGAK